MSLESVFKLSLILSMVDNLTGPMSKASSAVGGSVSKIDTMSQKLGNVAKTGAVVSGIGTQIAAAALAPVKATFETQNALGELASLGVKDLGAVEDAAKSFSNTWAGTTKADFISAAYDIKSGIASLNDEGVAQMTELSSLTAKATKSTAAEMSSLFATGYGIYKGYYSDLSDLQFGEMFSAGISKSVQQFKTTGSGMSQAISALGASATNSNVPLEEQLSILGMLQSTMSGSEAGTKYKAFLKVAAKGGQELGLDFMDANNQLLSMPEILAQLKGKFGDTMDAAEKMKLSEAFGDEEAVSLIDLMYNKTGDLQSNILTLNDSLGQGTSLTKEMANSMNNTAPQQWELLKQKAQNIAETLGTALLPTITAVMSKGEEIASKVQTWVSQHQQLAATIEKVVLGLGAGMAVGGAASAIIGTVGLSITRTVGTIGSLVKGIKDIPGLFRSVELYAKLAGYGIGQGFGAIAKVGPVVLNVFKTIGSGLVSVVGKALAFMPKLIASVWSFSAALLANPITWVVVGIIALIAAIVLLHKHWSQVTSFISDVWSSFINGIKAGFDRVKNWFASMPASVQILLAAFMPIIGIPLLIITHWSSITGFFSGLFGNVKATVSSCITGIKSFFTGLPEWFRAAGSKLITTFTEGIKAVAMAPVNAVKDIFQKVKNLLPHSDAKEGPLSTLTYSGKRTMTTYAHGVMLAQAAPAEAVEKGMGRTKDALGRDPIKKVSFKRQKAEEDNSYTEEAGEGGNKGVYIKQLVARIDFSKIKELPELIRLLQEVESYTNSNGGDVTDVETTPA